jgi:hypothetical protein
MYNSVAGEEHGTPENRAEENRGMDASGGQLPESLPW